MQQLLINLIPSKTVGINDVRITIRQKSVEYQDIFEVVYIFWLCGSEKGIYYRE